MRQAWPMVIQIGRQTRGSGVGALVLECHDRIRSSIAIAEKLGAATAPPYDDVRATAKRVYDYFADALPLHVADEEETFAPLLRGKDREADAALEEMARQHATHVEPLSRLLDLCQALIASPERHAELAPLLLDVSTTLRREFDAHLAIEETIILPAILRCLDPSEHAAMITEIRARRARARTQ